MRQLNLLDVRQRLAFMPRALDNKSIILIDVDTTGQVFEAAAFELMSLSSGKVIAIGQRIANEDESQLTAKDYAEITERITHETK